MNILMVISQFSPVIGGAERQAEILAQKLVEKGIRVTVLTGRWDRRNPRREVVNGVCVFRNFSTSGLIFPNQSRIFRLLGVVTYMISLAFYLLSHGREYDLIHAHQVLYPAFMSALIGRGILKKPVVAKNGCTGLTSDIKRIREFPFGNFQLKYLVKHLDCLIAVNEEGISEFKAVGLSETKIQHIPNGVSVPIAEKRKTDDVLHVISTVRLDRQKGIDVLLKAWAKVMVQAKTPRLLILGQGPLESELKKMTKFLGIGDSVEFVGLVNNPEDYLNKSDIFVLASRAEGMSNALLEAMSIGLSCIATNISGNRELICESSKQPVSLGEFLIEKNGILINPDDTEGLYKAILFLLRDKRMRKNIGRNGVEFIGNNYSIDLVADRYIALYQSILGKRD